VEPSSLILASSNRIHDSVAAGLVGVGQYLTLGLQNRSKVKWVGHHQIHADDGARFCRLVENFLLAEEGYAAALGFAGMRQSLHVARVLAETRLEASDALRGIPFACEVGGKTVRNAAVDEMGFTLELSAVEVFRWVVESSQAWGLWTIDSEVSWERLARLRPREYRPLSELFGVPQLGIGLRRTGILK